MTKSITESLYGLGDLTSDNPDSTRRYSVDNYKSGTTDAIPFEMPEYGKKEFPDEPWQVDLKNRIIAKKDTFVSVPPSRGKTGPTLKAIEKLFDEFIHRRLPYTPIFLYVVPRKQLAGQIAINDIQETLLKYILGKINPPITIPPTPPDPIFSFLRNPADIDKFVSNLVAEIVGGGPGRINTNINSLGFRLTPFIIATYEKAIEIMRVHGNSISHIIVDELQELLPHPGEIVSEGLEKRYTSLITVLTLAKPSTSVTLMTGSINSNTTNQLIDYFNIKYSRSFELRPLFNGTPMLNRSSISVQPLQQLTGYPNVAVPERIKLAKSIIANKQNNSIMIVFSKQRTSSQSIFRMIEEIIKIFPPRSPSYYYDSPSTTLNNPNLNHIQNKLDARILKSEDVDDIEYLKYFNISDVMQMGESPNQDKLLDPKNKDENNVLYQGILRGVGPIIGAMSQRHKQIVQNLFIKKKIQLLFATDALGVGANVECRYLYLPTIDKFNGGRLARLDESSLVQLVHRAGRAKFPIANVYCAIQDYEYINNLINDDPRSAVPEINPLELEKLQSLESKYGRSFVDKIIMKFLFGRKR